MSHKNQKDVRIRVGILHEKNEVNLTKYVTEQQTNEKVEKDIYMLKPVPKYGASEQNTVH